MECLILWVIKTAKWKGGGGLKIVHPAQLIKHILAMKRHFGRGGSRLLYLWFDVLGGQGKCHQDEIIEFAKVAAKYGIKFHSLT